MAFVNSITIILFKVLTREIEASIFLFHNTKIRGSRKQTEKDPKFFPRV